MIEQLDGIISKLDELKRLDADFHIFGSKSHEYSRNITKTEDDLVQFEKQNSIKLPEEYREFLKTVGNGGAGPKYGLEPIENGKFGDLEYRNDNFLIELSKPFPHTEPWNLDFGEIEHDNEDEYFELKEEEYFNEKWSYGLLRISNYGCGISANIVVNGKEHGNIWIDDRCNDMGIYPAKTEEDNNRLTFLNWYENWLDESIKECR